MSDDSRSVFTPSAGGDQKDPDAVVKRGGFSDGMEPTFSAPVDASHGLNFSLDRMHHGSIQLSPEGGDLFSTTGWYDWRGLELTVPDALTAGLETAKGGVSIIVSALEGVLALLSVLKQIGGERVDLAQALLEPLISKLNEVLELFRGKTGLHMLVVPPVFKEVEQTAFAATRGRLVAANSVAADYLLDKILSNPSERLSRQAAGEPSTPEELQDPSYITQQTGKARRTRGGNMGFYDAVVETLSDEGDLSRPRFGPNAWVGGTVFLVGSTRYARFFRLWSDLKRVFQLGEDVRSLSDPPPVTNLRAYMDSEMLVHNTARSAWVSDNPGLAGPDWYGEMLPAIQLKWGACPYQDSAPGWEPYKEYIIRMVDPGSVNWDYATNTNDSGMTAYGGTKELYEAVFDLFHRGVTSEIDPFGNTDIEDPTYLRRLPSHHTETYPMLNHHIIAERSYDGMLSARSASGVSPTEGFLASTRSEFSDLPDTLLDGVAKGVFNLNPFGWTHYTESMFKPETRASGSLASISRLSRSASKPLTYHYRVVRFYRRTLGLTKGRSGALSERVYEPHPEYWSFQTYNGRRSDGTPDDSLPVSYPQWRYNMAGVQDRANAAYAAVFSGLGTVVVPPGNRMYGPSSIPPDWKGTSFAAIMPNAVSKIVQLSLALISKLRTTLKACACWLQEMLDSLTRVVTRWQEYLQAISAAISSVEDLLSVPAGGYMLNFFGKGGNDFFTGVLRETLELGVRDRLSREEQKARLLQEVFSGSTSAYLGETASSLTMGSSWDDRLPTNLTSTWNDSVANISTLVDGMGTRDQGAWDTLEQLRRIEEGKDPDLSVIPDKYQGDFATLDPRQGTGVNATAVSRVGSVVPSYGDDDVAAGVVLLVGDATAQAVKDVVSMINLLFGGSSPAPTVAPGETDPTRNVKEASDALGADPEAPSRAPQFGDNLSPVEGSSSPTETTPGSATPAYDSNMTPTEPSSGSDDRCPS